MTTHSSIIEGPRFDIITKPRRSPWLTPAILGSAAVILLIVGTSLRQTTIPASSESQEQSTTVVETTLGATINVRAPVIPDVVISSISAETFVLEAQRGDGVTHLARRAISRHLKETGLAAETSATQRIYMEDFVKDAIGSRALLAGETVTFDPSLIASAVSAARTLGAAKLASLERFVPLVPSIML